MMELCTLTRDTIKAMQDVDIRTVDPEMLRESLLLSLWEICG